MISNRFPSDTANYSHSTVDLSKIAVRDHLGWLEADTNLEASWAPINELNGSLSLKCGNSTVDIVGDYISTVQETGSHVLPITRVAFYHLVISLETGHGDLLDRVGLM